MMATNSRQGLHTLEPQPLPALSADPLVSILLTNYNYGQYIRESIESVLSQTYGNWELVICDDGSTDNSLSVIEKLIGSDARVTLLTKQNGGHTSALNAAFSASRGDVICLLDADDLFLPNKVRTLVDAYAVHSDIGLIVHRIIRIDHSRRHKGVYPLSEYPSGWLGPGLLSSGGIIPCAAPTSAISLRRRIAESLFPISMKPPLNMCPDQVIMRNAPLITPINRIPEPLTEYRVHGHNAYSTQTVSAPAIAKQLAISRALWEEQYRFLAERDPELAPQLASIDQSLATAQLEYIQAKLENDPTAGERLKKYVSFAAVEELKWLAFWRLSIHLPNFIFRPALNLLMGQGAVKQAITRLRRLL